MTKPPYHIDSSLRKNYPAHHPQEVGGGGYSGTLVEALAALTGEANSYIHVTGVNSLEIAPIVGPLANDALVEVGNNTNGYYERWLSGIQECWTFLGGGQSTHTWVFPAAFITDPVPSILIRTSSIRVISVDGANSNENQLVFNLYDINGSPVSTGGPMVRAKGLWK